MSVNTLALFQTLPAEFCRQLVAPTAICASCCRYQQAVLRYAAGAAEAMPRTVFPNVINLQRLRCRNLLGFLKTMWASKPDIASRVIAADDLCYNRISGEKGVQQRLGGPHNAVERIADCTPSFIEYFSISTLRFACAFGRNSQALIPSNECTITPSQLRSQPWRDTHVAMRGLRVVMRPP